MLAGATSGAGPIGNERTIQHGNGSRHHEREGVKRLDTSLVEVPASNFV